MYSSTERLTTEFCSLALSCRVGSKISDFCKTKRALKPVLFSPILAYLTGGGPVWYTKANSVLSAGLGGGGLSAGMIQKGSTRAEPIVQDTGESVR